jgi:hypothetical protein
MIRVIAVVAILLLSVSAPDTSCRAVKRAVAKYGEAAVEAWARANGISDREIEKAKQCLR